MRHVKFQSTSKLLLIHQLDRLLKNSKGFEKVVNILIEKMCKTLAFYSEEINALLNSSIGNKFLTISNRTLAFKFSKATQGIEEIKNFI